MKSIITAVFLAMSCTVWAETTPAPATPPDAPQQPATGTAPVGDGIAYIFLIDTSKSITAAQFDQVKKALNAWIEAISDKDRMTIMTFGNEVRVLVDFTQNPALLQVAAGKLKLEDTKTKLHTALLRAIEIGARKDDNLPARRAIVLLSDGIDDYTGAMNREEVAERIKESKVPVFAVGFSNPPVTPEKEQALDALKRFSDVSGGHYERVDKKSFEEIYVEMRRRIRKLPVPQAATTPGAAADSSKTPELPPILPGGGGAAVGKLVPSAFRKSEVLRYVWLAALLIVTLGVLFLILRWVFARLGQAPAAPASVSTGAAIARPGFQPRTPIAYLEHSGGAIEIISFPCTVGAVRDNDIVINHDSLSRYHATLDYREGKFYVTDRDSTNGTRVGGKEVREAEIAEGTRVTFGSWEGVFRVGNPAERPKPAAAAAVARPASNLLSAPVVLGLASAAVVVALAVTAYLLLSSRSAGEQFQDALKGGGSGPMMVVIPEGKFFMGDIQRKGKPNEQPVHEVQVASFAIGKYEVTFAEYDYYCQVTGKPRPNDAGFGRGMNPVVNVSWKDAVAYTQWLSEQTGNGYRLPTEAEWEYAARGGSSGSYWWGDTALRDNGNYGAEACCGGAALGADRWPSTSPVGSFPANPFGVHDAAGNVFEWTCSGYFEPYSGQENTCNQDESLRKVFRGGSWVTPPDYSRSAWRLGRAPTDATPDQGFRVAMDL